MANERTEINTLGEFGLIEHLTKNIELQNASSVLGVGDDAAVIDHFGKQTVITTDLLVEGVHFDLSYMPLKHLGYKAVAVNASDICAMNATPKQITVGLAVSNRFSVEALEELYAGIRTACTDYNIDLIGGDTTSSQSGLMISITAIGTAAQEAICYRSGAKEYDLLVVSGDLGGAYMGLQVLEREKEVFKTNPNIQPDLDGHDYILQRQLKPQARLDVVKFLKDLGVKPTSMIDVSDGLASEVLHLCKQSNLGCRVYEEKLPIHDDARMAAFKFGLDPTVCALNGGEDYELIFTLKQEDYDKITLNEEISVIGYMADIEEGCKFLTKGGNTHPITAQGWNAFTK